MKPVWAVMAAVTLVGAAITMTIPSSFAQLRGNASQQAGTGGFNGNAQGGGGAQQILIILDASDSMNEPLSRGGQTKLEAAKQVVIKTLRTMPPNVNVGLRVYGHRPLGGQAMSGGGFGFGRRQGFSGRFFDSCTQSQLLVPVGANNRATIAAKLMEIEGMGKTPISYSIREAVNNDFWAGQSGPKSIILVSDGRETCSSDPCDLAVDMVRAGVQVRISTIGLATHDKVADQQLKCVATATRGRFYSTDTAAQLSDSLNDATHVETSVKARINPGP